jgi:hypothetical protein
MIRIRRIVADQQAAGSPMYELSEPFPIRIPLPVRRLAGPMQVDSIEFDGAIVRVAYRASAEQLGWWCGPAIHELLWLPEVRSPADAIEHYASWLSTIPKRSTRSTLQDFE